jgi:hypothetical protein
MQIPRYLPAGFNLRVMANSLDLNPSGKKLVELNWEASHFYIAIRQDATLEAPSASVAAVDFDY